MVENKIKVILSSKESIFETETVYLDEIEEISIGDKKYKINELSQIVFTTEEHGYTEENIKKAFKNKKRK